VVDANQRRCSFGRPLDKPIGNRATGRLFSQFICGKKLLRFPRQNGRMYEFDIFKARAAECEQRAKDSKTEDEKQSWLAIADSWHVTAKLRQTESQDRRLADKAEAFAAAAL
jgi:hypothetical protein